VTFACIYQIFHSKETGDAQDAHNVTDIQRQLASIQIFQEFSHRFLSKLSEFGLRLILVTPLALAELGVKVLASC